MVLPPEVVPFESAQVLWTRFDPLPGQHFLDPLRIPLFLLPGFDQIHVRRIQVVPRGQLLLAYLLPGAPGNHPGHQRRDQQQGHRHHHPAQAPAVPGFLLGQLARRIQFALAPGFAIGGLPTAPGLAGLQEGPLQRVQLAGVRLGPLFGLGQPRAAVELARIAPQRFPLLRRFSQMAVQAQSLPVLLQPPPQGVPLLDEGLVGHLHALLSGDDQAGAGARQGLQHRVHLAGIDADRVELGPVDPAAGVGHALAQGRKPQQHLARDRPLRFAQALVGGLGPPSQRALHPLAGFVGLHR